MRRIEVREQYFVDVRHPDCREDFFTIEVNRLTERRGRLGESHRFRRMDCWRRRDLLPLWLLGCLLARLRFRLLLAASGRRDAVEDFERCRARGICGKRLRA